MAVCGFRSATVANTGQQLELNNRDLPGIPPLCGLEKQ